MRIPYKNPYFFELNYHNYPLHISLCLEKTEHFIPLLQYGYILTREGNAIKIGYARVSRVDQSRDLMIRKSKIQAAVRMLDTPIILKAQ